MLVPGPPFFGHNGGPPLPKSPPGRPTKRTEATEASILRQLLDGIPIRQICRQLGAPSRATLARWREADPAFDRKCRWCQEEGFVGLLEEVCELVDRIAKQDTKWARYVLNLRKQKLARMNPAFFSEDGGERF